MKMRKRLLPLCLFLLLCLSALAGCGARESVNFPAEPTGSAEDIQSEAPPVGDKTPSSSLQAPDNVEPNTSEPDASANLQDAPEEGNDQEMPPALSQNLRNDAYFDKTLFIGDSIMEGIRQYVATERKNQTTLGEAKFLTSIMGITLADLVGDNDPCMYYSYGGKEAPLEELIDDMEVNRIFLLLGLNDLSATTATTEESVERYTRLITNLKEAFPEAEVVVITNPPKVASSWLPDYATNRSFGNERIGEFVSALTAMCDENEVPYVDAYGALKDDTGALPEEFCRDGYVHLNNAGSKVVVDALYAFAADRS